MKHVDMAVVISDPSADKEKFDEAGLNIDPHIQRMEKLDEHGHDIDSNFKDPEHPLQLVFVCAMWLTGFDAPTVSTLYLDKPMKDHSLMQTIARANRVSSFSIRGYSGDMIEKRNGEIVDYYNVFRNMKKALKDYALGDGDKGEKPVKEKKELFVLLDDAIAQTLAFCNERDIDLHSITLEGGTFKNIVKFNEYADILLSLDDWRKSFYVFDNTVSSLYEACKPEIFEQPVRPEIAVIQFLRGVVDSLVQQADIEAVSQKISELLDESVVVDNAEQFAVKEHQAEYQIIQKGRVWDFSTIDFNKLKADFKQAKYKNIEIADMRRFIETKLEQMIDQNYTRVDFAQRLQEIIDRYNAGSSSQENYVDEIIKFAQAMNEEDERHVRMGLNEDELELFDTIKKDKMTAAEEQRVKNAAKHLITRLLDEHPKVLVQDWWKDGQTQRKVKDAIEEVLDEDLPEDGYDRRLFKEKCDNVYDLVIDFTSNGRKWASAS
ncbi:MAG: type I restriction enzyme endonuclease domain-containing protein [Gammaproteobacteria bacterium]